MKLKIKNFGPIKKGEIDLSKRFYVFVGYNNSGKTYMAQLIWMLGKTVKLDYFSDLGDLEKKPLTNDDLTAMLDQYFKYVKEEGLAQYFCTNKDHFLLQDFDIDIKDKSDLLHFFTEKEFTIPNIAGSEYTLKKEKGKQSFSYDKIPPESHRQAFNITGILRGLLGEKNNMFLPANRLFYPSFYKHVYSQAVVDLQEISKMLQEGDIAKAQALSKSSYTKAMEVLIKKLYDLNNRAEPNMFYPELLDKLKEMIGGEITSKSVQGISPMEYYVKLKNNKELDMYLSSSASNQLATLYLYFMYWASEHNNFLIIDEPEENLHPKNQLELLNILLESSNIKDNRVLISTHSPVVADAVNNYMFLAYLRAKGVPLNKEIENHPIFNPNINLKVEDFGIYFFDGTTIIPYEFDDYGVSFKDFDIEQRSMRDIRDILTNQIYDHLNQEDEAD